MKIQFCPLRDFPSWGIVGGKTAEPRPAKFIPHNGFSRKRPKRDIAMTKLDRFAELLAEGLTVTQAAARLGHDYAYGNAMLQRIRTKLGSQAK